jgi:thiamine-monophosphate kinase
MASSGVCGRIDKAEVPVAEGATADEALTGGEDYELIVTLPPAAFEEARAELRETFGVALTKFGDVVEGSGIEDGATGLPIDESGWDHFHAR